MKSSKHLAVPLLALLLVANAAYAQLSPQLANCPEFQGNATQALVGSCSAHVGCGMVLKLQKSCASAKEFLGRLQGGLAGRTQITNNDVFEASSPALMPSPTLRSQVAAVQKIVLGAAGDPAKGRLEYKIGGLDAYYEGGLKEGKRHGVGVTIASNGQMDRSQYVNNVGSGYGQLVTPAGAIYVTGNWREGKLSGSGVRQAADGVIAAGTWDMGKLVGMWDFTYPSGNTQKVLYGADGRQVAAGPQAPPGQMAQAPSDPALNAAIVPNPAVAGVPAGRPAASAIVESSCSAEIAQALRVAGKGIVEGNIKNFLEDDCSGVDGMRRNIANNERVIARPGESATSKVMGTFAVCVQRAYVNHCISTASTERAPSGDGGARGLPVGECHRQANASNLGEKLNALPPNDSVLLARGAIFNLDFLIRTYSQCLPDPQTQQAINGWKAQREATLRTCRQISSTDNCLNSPFR